MTWRTVLPCTLVLTILAGGMRFYRLGTYSFGNDELATLAETVAMFEPGSVPQDSDEEFSEEGQGHRLPRILPVGYAFHYLGYQLFGRDEFGSRAMMAVLGTLTVLLVFLALIKPLGMPTAFATAMLVALWPEHLFHSQNHRFYITAGFFSAVAMLFGSLAIERKSVTLITIACVASLLSIGCQTLQGVMIGGLFVGIVAGYLAKKESLPWKMLAVIVGTGVLALLFLVFYLLPLIKGWNQGEQWGYSSSRSLLASVSQIGWPVVVLAVPGAVALWVRNRAQALYWLVFVTIWGVSSVLFPRLVTYHPAYAFPQALSVVVLAGSLLGTIHDSLKERSRVLAALALLAGCGLNLPAVASHFRDGGKHDYRGAAVYIAEHRQTGDAVATVSKGMLLHYNPDLKDAIALEVDPLPQLKEMLPAKQRTWIVTTTGRSGYPDDLIDFLGQHCHHMAELRKRRFDYYEYRVDIYLHDPKKN